MYAAYLYIWRSLLVRYESAPRFLAVRDDAVGAQADAGRGEPERVERECSATSRRPVSPPARAPA
jgi:hypothetical protein